MSDHADFHPPLNPGPYSNFHVGACVMMGSGEFFPGANIENASYPVGTCAERVALATAVVCTAKYKLAIY